MEKYNGKYVIICECCDSICGTYNRDTDEFKCKSVCDCGSDDLSYRSDIDYQNMLNGGIDHE